MNGAGALYDFGCYGVDLATWLQHGETPLTVTAVTQQLKPEKYPHVDDEGTIILTYPHAQAIIQGSWNWPFDRKDMEVYGATGSLKTIKSDKVVERTQGEKVATEREATPLAPPEDGSLDYLVAVLNGQLKPQGDLTSLDTNVSRDADTGCGADLREDGTDRKVTPLPSKNSREFISCKEFWGTSVTPLPYPCRRGFHGNFAAGHRLRAAADAAIPCLHSDRHADPGAGHWRDDRYLLADSHRDAEVAARGRPGEPLSHWRWAGIAAWKAARRTTGGCSRIPFICG